MIKHYSDIVYEWVLDKIIGLLELTGLIILYVANAVFSFWLIAKIFGVL